MVRETISHSRIYEKIGEGGPPGGLRMTFKGSGGHSVSTDGGMLPVWSRNGRELINIDAGITVTH